MQRLMSLISVKLIKIIVFLRMIICFCVGICTLVTRCTSNLLLKIQNIIFTLIWISGKYRTVCIIKDNIGQKITVVKHLVAGTLYPPLPASLFRRQLLSPWKPSIFREREAPGGSVSDGEHATTSLVCVKLCIAGNLIFAPDCDLVGHYVWSRVR